MPRIRLVIVMAIASAVGLIAPPAHAIRLTGTAADEVFFGTNKADKLDGTSSGFDYFFGKKNPKDRRDKILMGPGGIAFGGSGPDLIVGGVEANQIGDGDGKAGDVIRSAGGDDLMTVADGAKTIVDCGAGEDIVLADSVDKLTNCELVGMGTFSEFFVSPAISYGLIYGTTGGDGLIGTTDNEMLFGLQGNDTLNAGDGAPVELLDGGSGADTMNGEAGSDQVYDDDGTPGDHVNGGAGSDTLFSADGAADFVDCGAGDSEPDAYFVDAQDTVTNCDGLDDGYLDDGNIVAL